MFGWSKQKKAETNVADSAGEILKFSKLHDQGVLTDEEFKGKKAQLLGLSPAVSDEKATGISVPDNSDKMEVQKAAVVTVNGKEIDLSGVIESYGKKPEPAIKWLRKQTDVGLKEAIQILDDAYSKYCSFSGSQAEEDIALRQRIAKMDAQGVPYCPKCFSTNLRSDKKGFGVGKAVVGASVAGAVGLAAGNMGAKKIRMTCLKCGYQFWAGKE